MLADLSRYIYRVAISNRSLIALDAQSVTFKVKDCRIEGPGRYATMALKVGEFIRRLLTHVLPNGFHASATTALSPAAIVPKQLRPA